MGKSLRDLLRNYQFEDERFNPRNVTPDMLSSKEIGGQLNIGIPKTTIGLSQINLPLGKIAMQPGKSGVLKDIIVPGLTVTGIKLPYDRQYTLLTNRIADIYGADAPRILLRGVVDTKKATKKILNRAGEIISFGSDSALGSFVRNSLTGLVGANQPSDNISGNSTRTGLYSDMYNARVNNSQNPITGLLTQFRTPSQFKAAVGDISNGKVKIGGAVIDELTNLSFKGLGWAAAKIGLGRQDAGKTKSLSETLRDSNNSNLASVSRFPSVFVESNAKITKQSIPTGIVIGQDQFAKLGDFPNMYDDSPIKTGLTFDGRQRNIGTFTQLATSTDDYLTINPQEKSKFVQIDRFNSKAGEMPQDSQLGFNPNSVLFVNRSQNFRGIFNNYQLFGSSRTNLNTGVGQTTVVGQVGELISTTPDKDTFLLVKSGQYDDDFIYKTPDIISKGKPKRFSEKVTNVDGTQINYYLFGGYSDRKATPIKGDHRLKSNIPLVDNKSQDLIAIAIGQQALLANITGLTDTATPSWGDAQGIGSPYKFYFYESFEREISFKAQIYASSEKTLPKVWEKANNIMKLTAGKAQGQLGIQGYVIKLKIGDILKAGDGNGIDGFISSCTMTVPDISPWEIQLGKQAPFVCELDISFKVINTTEQDFYDTVSSTENVLFQEEKSKYPRKSPPPPVAFDISQNARMQDTADLMKIEAGMVLDPQTQNFLDTQNNEYIRGAIRTARVNADTADLLASNINFGEEAGIVSQQTSFVNDAVRNAIQNRQGELLNESLNTMSGEYVDNIVRGVINNRTSTSATGGSGGRMGGAPE